MSELGVIKDSEDLNEVNRFVMLIFNIFEICVPAFIIVGLWFSFLFRTVGVEGGSMQNTLHDRDRLLVISNFLKKPKIKDIVIINTVDILDALIVKRVIANEGQIVDMKKEDNKYYVYIDGQKIDEPYAKEPINEDSVGNIRYPIVIPEGYVFVMGDNRNDSKDSRIIGLINLEKIMGVCTVRLFPLKKFTIF